MPQRKIRTVAWVGSASTGIASLLMLQAVGCYERAQLAYDIKGECSDGAEGCTSTSATTGAGGAPSGSGTGGAESSACPCDNDEKPCTKCNGSTCENTAAGKPCGNAGLMCDGNGECVACLKSDARCEEEECPRCDGEQCEHNTDCQSHICEDEHCRTIECERCKYWDTATSGCQNINFNEEDKDAPNGQTCEAPNACDGNGGCKTAILKTCTRGEHCISGNCENGKCLAGINQQCNGDNQCMSGLKCATPDGSMTDNDTGKCQPP